MKNPVTLPGIDPGTVRIVAQRLNHYATPGPNQDNITTLDCKTIEYSMGSPLVNLFSGLATTKFCIQTRFFTSCKLLGFIGGVANNSAHLIYDAVSLGNKISREDVHLVVCFLLGGSPASEFFVPTFRNTLSVPSVVQTSWTFIIFLGNASPLCLIIRRLEL